MTDEYIKYKLQKLYPNNIIYALSENKSVYASFRKSAREKGLSSEEYASELGFQWREKPRGVEKSGITDEYIIRRLEKLYPDKKIISLSKNMNFYQIFKRAANERNLSTDEYASKIGYKIIYGNQGISSGTYDVDTLRILYEKFSANISDIADIFGCKRQNIHSKIKYQKKNKVSWLNKDITPEEHEIITRLLDIKQYKYDSDNLNVRIYYNDSDYAIFLCSQNEVKCILDLSKYSIIYVEFEKRGLLKYSPIDIMIYDAIIEKEYVSDNEEVRIPRTDKELNAMVNNRLRKLQITKVDYFKRIGFDYVYSSKRTEDELFEELKKFIVPGTNKIFLPCNESDHYRITNTLYRRGYNLKDFIEKYGYTYITDREIGQKKKKEFKKELAKRVIFDNKVYLSSSDKLYINLTNYAKRRNITLSQIVETLGFIRVDNLQLPNSYTKFDWRADYLGKIRPKYEKYLERYTIDDKRIFLKDSIIVFKRLEILGRRLGIDIVNILTQWGYQVFSELNEKDRKTINIKNKLKQLKEIQNKGCGKKLTITEQQQRNRQLVKALKELYNYRCQVCGDDVDNSQIPIIIKEDGTIYIEVHHIKPLSQSQADFTEANEELDIKDLDTYENALCLCCFHHKYVHYHKGGFFNLYFDKENGLYLLSKHGDVLKIELNYHLKY